MKLQITNLHKRTHKMFVITGDQARVKAAVDIINTERLNYNMDYLDLCSNKDGESTAEYCTHRKDHKKAAAYIESVLLNVRKLVVVNDECHSQDGLDAFENIVGHNFTEATDSDYDKTESAMTERAQALLISDSEIAELEKKGFLDLAVSLTSFKEANLAHDLSKSI